jgi:hypothetical protein
MFRKVYNRRGSVSSRKGLVLGELVGKWSQYHYYRVYEKTSVSALNPHSQSQYTLVLSFSETVLESGLPIDHSSTMPGIPYRKGCFERDECLTKLPRKLCSLTELP